MKVSDAVVEVAAKAAYAEVMKDYNPNPGGNWKKEMLSVRERYRANARAALEAALPLVLNLERLRDAAIGSNFCRAETLANIERWEQSHD